MKTSIAGKLTARTAVLMLLTLCILFVGAYHTVGRLVNDEMGHYTSAISSIYADMLAYEAEEMHLALDETFAETFRFYGEYICSWYRVDCTFVYSPDPENGTVRVYDVTVNAEKYPENPAAGLIGQTLPYEFTADELAVIREETYYAARRSGTFENTLETVTTARDTEGRRIMVGVGVSLDDMEKTIRSEFLPFALLLVLVFAAVTALLYLVIRQTIHRPAKRISETMTAFITDGERSGERLPVEGNDEFAMIADAYDRMADGIDEYLANIDRLSRDRERAQTELDIAGNIQKGFLAAERYKTPFYEIGAVMKPAKDVGGDLYDYLPLDENRTLIAVADVSGKGISAALYMTVTLVLVRQYAKMGKSPAGILRAVNDAISEHNPKMLFATAFVGIYDKEAKRFTYAGAGHNPPYLISGRPKKLDGAQNTLLGLFPGEEYDEAEVTLGAGDIVYLYTDGASEAVDRSDAFFGEERLERALGGFRASHEENLVPYMERAVRDFTGDAEQHDDITMLALTVKETTDLKLDVNVQEFEKIRDVILKSGLPRSLQFRLCVAAEEIFVNICSYAYEDGVPEGEKIVFTFEVSDRFVLRFIDGGRQYDPRENAADPESYDVDEDVGGLGRLIAFTVSDRVDYEYRDGKNILTMIKYWQEEEYDHHENQ